MTATVEQQEQLMKLQISEVKRVYSGRSGKCMCGCSGIWRYSKDKVEQGSKDRGYEVGQDEVNDGFVKRVVTKLKLNASKVEFGEGFTDEKHFVLTEDGRDYVVYF